MLSLRIPGLGPAPTGSGRGRTGLAFRLQLAFASIALLTVLGAVGTFLLFGRIETVVGRMAAERAPEALNMLELEGVVRELAAKAPAIAASREAERLAESREAFQRTLAALAARLEAASGATRAELEVATGELTAVLTELASQRERLNTDIESLRRDLERLTAGHRAVLEAISGPIDDLAFDLVLGIESLSELGAYGSLEDEVRTLVDGKWTPIQALFVLRGEANGIYGLLAQAAMAEEVSILQPLRERFVAASEAARSALDELSPALRDGIGPTLAQLTAFGEGERSLFAQRRALLEKEARLLTLARDAEEISKSLEAAVEVRVAAAREALAAGTADIDRMLAGARWLLLAAALLVVAVSVAIGWFYLQRNVVRRLNALHAATLAVAEGHREVTIPAEGADELAAMGRALAVFRDKSAEVERLEAERRELAAATEEEKRRAQQALAERLEAEIGAIADQFARAASSLSNAARDLASSEEGGDSTGKIELVARTCRELELAAKEIAEQMDRARAIGESATADSERSTRAVEELDAAIAEIEEVVTLISDIAEQTNLLALNATIEAARAGESGRGFAVVASEVKALANQTANATGKIAERIAAIRQNSRSTVEAITTTSATVRELADVAGAVAAALEEQSAATHAILENVEVAIGSASEMRRAADGVSGDAERLRGEVRSFVEQIKAA